MIALKTDLLKNVPDYHLLTTSGALGGGQKYYPPPH